MNYRTAPASPSNKGGVYHPISVAFEPQDREPTQKEKSLHAEQKIAPMIKPQAGKGNGQGPISQQHGQEKLFRTAYGNALTGFHGSRLDVCITSRWSVIRVFSKTGDIDLADLAGHHSITELQV